MLHFIVCHLFEYGAAAVIRRCEPQKMPAQMSLDLPLGFGDEAQAGPVAAQETCRRAYRERTHVPERIQKAGASVELGQALLAPGEVIRFFPGRMLHRVRDLGSAGGKRLTVVKRLRRDLARVIHAHEPDRLALLRGAQRLGAQRTGCRPRGPRGRG